MWKNLFPQGSRTIELCSAYGLIILAVLSSIGVPILPEILLYEPKLEGLILLSIFGTLQLLALYHYPKIEVLRVMMAWLTGCFWVWVGVTNSTGTISAEDIATIMLGMGNLYGFILNFNLLKVSWKL